MPLLAKHLSGLCKETGAPNCSPMAIGSEYGDHKLGRAAVGASGDGAGDQWAHTEMKPSGWRARRPKHSMNSNCGTAGWAAKNLPSPTFSLQSCG